MTDGLRLLPDPCARLESAFSAIYAERMRRPGLRATRPSASRQSRFAPWKGYWLGVMLTPWSMNLLLAPRDPAAWRPLPEGEKRQLSFPAGSFDFISAHSAAIGEYLVCSLFSPLLEFADHETARQAALLARDALFDAANAESPQEPIGNLSPRPLAELRSATRAPRFPGAISCTGGSREAAMPLEGEFVVRLHWHGHRVQQVTLRSSRPFAAARMLAGKQPRDVVATMPLLFSICGGRAACRGRKRARCRGRARWVVQRGSRRGRCGPGNGAGVFLAPAHRLAGGDGQSSRCSRRSPRRDARSPRRHADRTACCPGATRRRANSATSLARLATTSLYAVSPAQWLGLGDVQCAGRLDRPRRNAAGGAAGRTHAPYAGGRSQRRRSDADRRAAKHSSPPSCRPCASPGSRGAHMEWRSRWKRARCRACARSRWWRRVAARHGNAVVTRMVARLAELAVLLTMLASRGRRGAGWPSRIQALALGPGEGARRRYRPRAACCCIARALAGGRVAGLSDRRPDRMELPSRRRARPRPHRPRGGSTKRRSSSARASQCRRSIPASRVGSRWAMHEMALAASVLEIVEGTARQNGAARVSAVWLEIGALSHVEPEAMRFCFDAVTRGSLADRARLEIVTTPGAAWCMPCGDTVPLAALGEPCPRCGSLPARRVAGRGDAGEGNRARLNARPQSGRRRATEQRRMVMCTTCGCGNGETRIEGKTAVGGRAGAPQSISRPRRRHRAAAAQGAQPGIPARGRCCGAQAPPRDGTWHSHVHGGGSAHGEQASSSPARAPHARAGHCAFAHGADRAGHPGQERRARRAQPALLRATMACSR